jgi:hypothetical protein
MNDMMVIYKFINIIIKNSNNKRYNNNNYYYYYDCNDNIEIKK